ncbi:MAG: FHA domain-containing protein [Myxococcota bacterium]
MTGWDKRATERRKGSASPRARDGVYLVYVGLSDHARAHDTVEPATVALGDAFRLLPGAVIAVGRSELCEVTIDAPCLASHHALLTFAPGGPQTLDLLLIDLDTATGSWVEGRRAPVQRLHLGQTFELGRTFCFRCQSAT